ncbi:unnamed protein product [Linum trigynum]|uniref:DUF4283 domain-containing protein n=1 Tax=Linum trigynum TaxID=586398 RepID=A0AAV2E393_9ROSI
MLLVSQVLTHQFPLTLFISVGSNPTYHPPMVAELFSVYNDEAVVVAEERAELSLLGKIHVSAPSLGSLQNFLVDLWNCRGSITVLSVDEGLVQFIFIDTSDHRRVRDKSPWTQSRFLIHLRP